MTLYETINLIEDIARHQPNVRSAAEGNIYDFMNANPSVEYDVIFLTQGTHRTDEEFDHYNFIIFYASRLQDDLEDNRKQIQSIGKEVLENVLKTLRDEYDIEIGERMYSPYTQKFSDLCAGMYVQVELIIPIDYYCGEDYE